MNSEQHIFQKVLNPLDTSTGGGSASAIAGCMAGSLIEMVCRLNVRGETEVERGYLDICAAKARLISDNLLVGADDDRKAFQQVRDAYRLPKATEIQIAARQQAIQIAWEGAARIPLQNAGNCFELIGMINDLVDKTNPAARSDLSCAFHLARAGCLGCLDNVAINIPNIKNLEIAEGIQIQRNKITVHCLEAKTPV